MKLQNEPLFMILVAFLKNIPTSFSSLIVGCGVFEIFLIEVHLYTINENWSHRLYMLLSKHTFGISYDFLSWISCLIYFYSPLVCACFSMDHLVHFRKLYT